MRAALVACQPSPACRAEFIRSFGLKAFRRPLDTGEVAATKSCFRSRPISWPARNWWSRRCCNRPTSSSAWKTPPIRSGGRTRPPAGSPMRCGTPCPTTRCSPPPPRRSRYAGRASRRSARRMLDDRQGAPGARRVRRAVAALRSRPDRHQGAPRVPELHARYGHRHDPGGAPLRLRPGLERPQFHGALHRAIRLRQRRPGAHLRRRAAGQRFRPRGFSGELRARRDCSGRRCS